MSNAEIDLNTIPLPADPAEPSSGSQLAPQPVRTFTPPPTFDDIIKPATVAAPATTPATTPSPTSTTATKASVGTIVAAIGTGATAASTMLPEPFNGYITAGVAILGIVATFFGIYLPKNKTVVG